MLARPLSALRVLQVIGAEPLLAELAVDEWIAEAAHVTRRLPDLGVQDDRRVERDDVVALLHHRREPPLLDVVLQQHAVVAVVVRRAEPAVDLGRGKDESAALAERDDLVHRDGVGHGVTLTGIRCFAPGASARRASVITAAGLIDAPLDGTADVVGSVSWHDGHRIRLTPRLGRPRSASDRLAAAPTRPSRALLRGARDIRVRRGNAHLVRPPRDRAAGGHVRRGDAQGCPAGEARRSPR